MDSYQDHTANELAKRIGQNFCAILWTGVEEHDMPQLYYYFANTQNQMATPEGDPSQQEEIMVNVTKRIVGLSQVSENLCGQTRTRQF